MINNTIFFSLTKFAAMYRYYCCCKGNCISTTTSLTDRDVLSTKTTWWHAPFHLQLLLRWKFYYFIVKDDVKFSVVAFNLSNWLKLTLCGNFGEAEGYPQSTFVTWKLDHIPSIMYKNVEFCMILCILA